MRGTVPAKLDLPASVISVLPDSSSCKGYRLPCADVLLNSTGLSDLEAQMIKV